MSYGTTGKVAIGEIVGYKRPLIPLRKNVKVFIKIGDEVITVLVDYRQPRFIRDKHAAGHKVAVGYYGGEWHIGSPPAASNEFTPERNIADIDLLRHEIEGIDLMELITRPSIGFEAYPGQALPDPMVAVTVPGEEKALIDSMFGEIDGYRDYIMDVEQAVRDSSDGLLESMGLSHLNETKKKQHMDAKKQPNNGPDKLDPRYLELLDSIIAQNNEIISNQKEIIRLLMIYSGSINVQEREAKLN